VRVDKRDAAASGLRKALWREGIRYRKNYCDLPGAPDIAITKYRIAVFCERGPGWTPGGVDHADGALASRGWVVFRFRGPEIERDLGGCVWEIKEAIIHAQVEAERAVIEAGDDDEAGGERADDDAADGGAAAAS